MNAERWAHYVKLIEMIEGTGMVESNSGPGWIPPRSEPDEQRRTEPEPRPESEQRQ